MGHSGKLDCVSWETENYAIWCRENYVSRGVLLTRFVQFCYFKQHDTQFCLCSCISCVAAGLSLFFSNGSEDNSFQIRGSHFHSNLAGIGGGLVIPLDSEEVKQRAFDSYFDEYAPGLVNESFPVSVPSENLMSIEDCQFVANSAIGSGSALAMLMLFDLTTRPLPVRINRV